MKPSSRFGNVTSALLVAPGANRGSGPDAPPVAIIQLLDSFFEQRLVLDCPANSQPPGLGVVARALERASSERVILLEARPSPVWTLALADLLLAIVCWPEADAVVPEEFAEREQPICGIFRREPGLERARSYLADGEIDERRWLESLSPSRVSLSELGFASDERSNFLEDC